MKRKILTALLLIAIVIPMVACGRKEAPRKYDGVSDVKTEGVEYVDAFEDLKKDKNKD